MGQGQACAASASKKDLQTEAAAGSVTAARELGRLSITGEKGFPVDYGKAVQWLEQAASQNDPQALTALGGLYENGTGVQQDFAKAFACYTKAAEQGYDDGQRALGVLYELGKGVPKDPGKAAYWYEKAAVQGLPRAQANLGFLYENGLGVEQDYEKARFWYEKSAAKDYPRGQTFLGRMYEKGLGVPVDREKALHWYRTAAGLKYAKAEQALRSLEGKEKGKEKGKEVDKSATALPPSVERRERGPVPGSEKKGEEAQVYFDLGLKYLKGEGVEKNSERAAYWLEQALRLGSEAARPYLEQATRPDGGSAADARDGAGTADLPGAKSASVEGAGKIEKGAEDIETDKAMARQFFNLGNEYAREERFEMAIAAFRKAIALDSGNKNTRENLAVVLAKTGNLGEAIEIMRLLAQGSSDAAKLVNLAIMLHSAGRYEEALSFYRKALREDPAMARGYHGMAVILAQNEDYGAAWDAIVMAQGLGLSEADTRKKVEKVMPKPSPDCTTAEEARFYLRQVVVDSRARADEVRNRLSRGENFQELLAIYRVGPADDKGGNGNMGMFTAGELDPQVESAVLSIGPFAYSRVVETKAGYHVFQKIPYCRALLEERP